MPVFESEAGHARDVAAFWISRWRTIDRAQFPNSAAFAASRALHFIRKLEAMQ